MISFDINNYIDCVGVRYLDTNWQYLRSLHFLLYSFDYQINICNFERRGITARWKVWHVSSWGAGCTGNLVHVKQLCVRYQIFLSCLLFHMRKKYFRKIENSVESYTLWMIAVNKYSILSCDLQLQDGSTQADYLCRHTFMKALYFQTKMKYHCST